MTDHDDTDSETVSLLLKAFVENIPDGAPEPQDKYASFTRNTDEELNEFPPAPDERLLRVLVVNPEKPRTHEEFVEWTDLASNTITNALERLGAQGLIDDRGGRYFIPESRQSTVDGLLTDTRQLRVSNTESIQERSISELDPQSEDAHILTFIYNNPSREYSVVEIQTGLDDVLDFTRDTIEEAVSRLYEEDRIQKTADGHYQAIESCEELRRFAASMESTKRMFQRYRDCNTDNDNTDEEAAESF